MAFNPVLTLPYLKGERMVHLSASKCTGAKRLYNSLEPLSVLSSNLTLPGNARAQSPLALPKYSLLLVGQYSLFLVTHPRVGLWDWVDRQALHMESLSLLP